MSNCEPTLKQLSPQVGLVIQLGGPIKQNCLVSNSSPQHAEHQTLLPIKSLDDKTTL